MQRAAEVTYIAPCPGCGADRLWTTVWEVGTTIHGYHDMHNQRTTVEVDCAC